MTQALTKNKFNIDISRLTNVSLKVFAAVAAVCGTGGGEMREKRERAGAPLK